MAGFQKPSTIAKQTSDQNNPVAEKVAVPQKEGTIKGHKIQASELLKSVLGRSIDGVSKGINTKISDTIFSTGAKDELLTVDIYGKENSDVINTFTDKLKGLTAGQFGLGGAKSSIVSDLLSIAKSGKSGKFDLGSMTDRIVKEMGGSSGILNNLTDAAKGPLTSSLGISSTVFDKMKVKLGEVYSAYQGGDLTSARGIFDLMGRFAGDSELFKMIDLGAQSNLLAGLINQAISFGVPESIDRLIEHSQDTRVTEVALQGNINTAIEYGDIRTLDRMTTQLGAGRILSQSPLAVQILLARYKIPNGKKDTDYVTLWTELKALLNKINPQWLYRDRNGVLLTNLDSFLKVSNDVKRIAVHDTDVSVALMIASDYQPQDLMEMFKKQYPLLAA
jgi:hypothetical protein